MVQQYNSILPVDIRTFPQLLEFLNLKKEELDAAFMPESAMYVPDLNDKIMLHFSPKKEEADEYKRLAKDI